MTKYIALLRAVNVGGTGKLPMSELKAMCCDAGFAHVETYIASGNVVFESKAAMAMVKSELERRLLVWPDGGLAPVPGRPGVFSYGFIPAGLFAQVKAKFLELNGRGRGAGARR